MEELDLLKKDWNRNDSFEQVSEQELYKMLHKRSSSIVKWIFFVSVFELALGFLLSFLTSFSKNDAETMAMIERWGIYPYYIGVTVLFYAIVFYFIYKFYVMYRKISVVNNTKNLLSSIIKTRLVVKQYIAFNLSAFAVLFVGFGSYMLYRGYFELKLKNGVAHPAVPFKLVAEGFVILVVIAAVLTLMLWGIYKLVYGLLLKKLSKNYQELKKIDL